MNAIEMIHRCAKHQDVDAGPANIYVYPEPNAGEFIPEEPTVTVENGWS